MGCCAVVLFIIHGGGDGAPAAVPLRKPSMESDDSNCTDLAGAFRGGRHLEPVYQAQRCARWLEDARHRGCGGSCYVYHWQPLRGQLGLKRFVVSVDYDSMPGRGGGVRRPRTNTDTACGKHDVPIRRRTGRGQGAGGLFPACHGAVEGCVIGFKPGVFQATRLRVHWFLTPNGYIP